MLSQWILACRVAVGVVMGKHNVEMDLTDDTTMYSLSLTPGILIATQFPAEWLTVSLS